MALSARATTCVSGVGVCAAIGGRAHAAFGIGLEHDAAEIGHGAVEFVRFGRPPGGDFGVEWIEGVEAADALGAAEIDRNRDLHAPRAERIGDARDLRNEIGRENLRVGVNVVDGASIDAERGQHAAVVIDAAQIFAGVHILPKDRGAAVAALDNASEVVPLIHPTDGDGRRLLLIQIDDGFTEGYFAQQREGAIEHAATISGGGDGVVKRADRNSLEPVTISNEIGVEMELGRGAAEFL